jgi:type II secretory pathway component GspD/PulD (secretin)
MITHDGFISLKVKPEVSSVPSTYKTASGNQIPIVETSQAETTVLLGDGATIMIGGLMKEQKTNNSDSIPWIGKIPLIGFFFRNTADSKSKTELAIFLTCKILDLESPVLSSKAAGSGLEAGKPLAEGK